MSENPIPLEIEHSKDLPDQEAEKKKNRRDFRLGLIGSTVLNVAFTLLIFSDAPLESSTIQEGTEQTILGLFQISLICASGLDIFAIIALLMMRRPAIAGGILVSYALSFGLTFIAGFLVIACFSVGGRYLG